MFQELYVFNNSCPCILHLSEGAFLSLYSMLDALQESVILIFSMVLQGTILSMLQNGKLKPGEAAQHSKSWIWDSNEAYLTSKSTVLT